jgi:type VI secretion system protein ImpF
MASALGSTSAGRVPLFDRLVDEAPSQQRPEAVPQRTLDRAGLKRSILRELRSILGTRCPLTGDAALSRARTVIDYGLPDLELGGKNLVPEEQRRLSRLVRQTIEAYEPRLRNVEVEVIRREDPTPGYFLRLGALLVTDEVREPLSFEMPLDPSAGVR